jgi:hypothetical protein
VFGGAVDTDDVSYASFLIPGVMAANAALVGTTAAVGVATDISSGIVDRSCSLPMSRSAILGGTAGAGSDQLACLLKMMSIQGCQSPLSSCSSQCPVMTLPSSLNLPVNLVVFALHPPGEALAFVGQGRLVRG